MIRTMLFGLLACHALVSVNVSAQVDHSAHMPSHDEHESHDMLFDRSGMVMNANSTVLPRGCENISENVDFTIRAGTDYAIEEAGRVFGYSQYDFQVPACSRVNIVFINEDEIRHQWMLHGLPRYLYPQGMFHLEASGGETVRGSFIVPADDATYLVHCDVTQHMEKGMKAQFIVGKGSGTLWSIPSVSADFKLDSRSSSIASWLLFCSTISAFILLMFFVKKGFSAR